ncbi:MAG TPA: DUF1553 domain-containing protein, partial [Pirellulales bacterium]|nr:DUF1553 domain-containing protein [Pirellulales bacterium]
EQFRIEAVVDRVSTTGNVFLGLTLGCARCHDHKYDPISQREFYQFFALLNNADEPTLSLPTTQQSKELPAIDAEVAAVEKRLAEADGAIDSRQKEWEVKVVAQFAALDASGAAPELLAILKPLRSALAVPRDKRSKAQRKLILEEYRKHDVERAPLTAQLDEVKQRQKQIRSNVTTTLVMKERTEPRETFVHLRGDFLRPGARVEPDVPGVLAALVPLRPAHEHANRLDLARWLVDRKNPLTPRVAVNRIWQEYFGQGLVTTENDFGTQGDRPTHPELLDWLASEFIARGWSMKSLHQLIVTSSVYRQDSKLRKELAEKDPYNKLLARQARLRLDAEVIRDSALAASGLLSTEIGGPGVYPPQPEGIYRFTQTKKFWNESTGPDRYRRAMYTYFWRSSPYPFLTTFDAPDATNTCTRRVRSNTPLQALTLANDRAFFELAQGLAARVLREAGDGDRARIERAVRLCLVREPTEHERSRLEKFVAGQRTYFAAAADADSVAPKDRPAKVSAAEAAVWTALARVVLNLDEFVTRE